MELKVFIMYKMEKEPIAFLRKAEALLLETANSRQKQAHIACLINYHFFYRNICKAFKHNHPPIFWPHLVSAHS